MKDSLLFFNFALSWREEWKWKILEWFWAKSGEFKCDERDLDNSKEWEWCRESYRHYLPGKGKYWVRLLQGLNLTLGSNRNPFGVLRLTRGTSFACGLSTLRHHHRPPRRGVPCGGLRRTITVSTFQPSDTQLESVLLFSRLFCDTDCLHCRLPPLI